MDDDALLGFWAAIWRELRQEIDALNANSSGDAFSLASDTDEMGNSAITLHGPLERSGFTGLSLQLDRRPVARITISLESARVSTTTVRYGEVLLKETSQGIRGKRFGRSIDAPAVAQMIVTIVTTLLETNTDPGERPCR